MKFIKARILQLVSIVLLLFFGQDLKAQQISSISGKVVDQHQEILMGNVFVLSVVDSHVIKGMSFTNGSFELLAIDQKEVFLKLTSLLFADTMIKVKYDGKSHVNLGTIVIRENKVQLNEVLISSQVPSMRYNSSGNMELNVANTVLASSTSATELLSRAPNVILTDGVISVYGKGEAIVYLNGKQITAEQLAAIPVSQIDKIEIIANPSSKYDAEGKAVINIRMKVNGTEGFLGSASQAVSASGFAGRTANTLLDLNYMKGKLAMIGNYGLLTGNTREVLNTTRTRSLPEDYLKSELRTDWKRKLNNYSNYGLGLQYHINPKSDVSLGYTGILERQGGTQNSDNKIITNEQLNFYSSNINKKEERNNHSFTLNYNRALDSLGSALFVGSQFSDYQSTVDDLITEQQVVKEMDGSRFLKNGVLHNTSISSTQVDYTRVFNAKMKLEAGAKFSYVHTASETDFLISENGADFKPDLNLSSNFKYQEKIPAAYLNYTGAINDQTSFGMGLRGEWTNYQLNTSVGAGQVVEDHYFNIFPNLLLSKKISEQFKLIASYVSKITRPRYQALNPYVIYQDPFTTIEGNPNLIPEKTHAFELGLYYKKIDLKMGYNYIVDPLSAAALRGTTANSYVLKGINLAKNHTYFASLSASLNVKWWTSINTINFSYTKLIDNQFGFELLKPKPQIYLYTSNTFNVDELFRIQLLAWYLGDRSSGLYYDAPRSTITIGVEKDFFSNALKLKFTANDLFHKSNASGTYGVGQTDIYYHRTYNLNYFRFTAAYSFGQLKKSNYKNKTPGQTENSRAN
ncbi:outer membrane beta-barrel family protein [Pedobacter caeni]|uniref:Outer membrane receptor proteins, mostly Fe transport n=1 Tax=Pedobacter caeni TaxID=288992 RepID=A0A1M4UPZ1_9SPHI|nr:outer membrane beta-barrel family protein [Pedobacter caeni]SHE58735.1 Outer membrane receptor proteins, mostly Fe transport [Pedobacter caeni]